MYLPVQILLVQKPGKTELKMMSSSLFNLMVAYNICFLFQGLMLPVF